MGFWAYCPGPRPTRRSRRPGWSTRPAPMSAGPSGRAPRESQLLTAHPRRRRLPGVFDPVLHGLPSLLGVLRVSLRPSLGPAACELKLAAHGKVIGTRHTHCRERTHRPMVRHEHVIERIPQERTPGVVRAERTATNARIKQPRDPLEQPRRVRPRDVVEVPHDHPLLPLMLGDVLRHHDQLRVPDPGIEPSLRVLPCPRARSRAVLCAPRSD